MVTITRNMRSKSVFSDNVGILAYPSHATFKFHFHCTEYLVIISQWVRTNMFNESDGQCVDYFY
jgi:hypothetical protein